MIRSPVQISSPSWTLFGASGACILDERDCSDNSYASIIYL